MVCIGIFGSLLSCEAHSIFHLPPPPTPFHWTAILLRSWRTRSFSKIIPNRRGSVDNHTIWGLGASSTLPLRFYYASATTMKMRLRLVYTDGDAAATLSRPRRWSYALDALLNPFYIKSEVHLIYVPLKVNDRRDQIAMKRRRKKKRKTNSKNNKKMKDDKNISKKKHRKIKKLKKQY